MEAVAEMSRPIAVVMMTGFGTVETAIHAMKLGAADYVLKPFKLRDIHRALSSAHERVEAIRARRQDTALRHFYEHCHRVETLDDYSCSNKTGRHVGSAIGFGRRGRLRSSGRQRGMGEPIRPNCIEQMLFSKVWMRHRKTCKGPCRLGHPEWRRLAVQLGATNGDESGIESILGALARRCCVCDNVYMERDWA